MLTRISVWIVLFPLVAFATPAAGERLVSAVLEGPRISYMTCELINDGDVSLSGVSLELLPPDAAQPLLGQTGCGTLVPGATCALSYDIEFPKNLVAAYCAAEVPAQSRVRGGLRFQNDQRATLAQSDLQLDLAAKLSGGVVEIDQARALAGGVSAGDAPGFPVLISEPGVYRLTGPLSLPGGSDVDSHGIEIRASHVTLDLAGFTMTGNAAGPGLGNGVDIRGATNVEVRNGTLENFPSTGMHAEDASNVRALAVQSMHNVKFHGFNLHASMALVRDCRALSNGLDGIDVKGDGSMIQASAASLNGRDGIVLASAGIIESSTSSYNGNHGFHIGWGLVTNSSGTWNGGEGLDGYAIAKLRSNSFSFNNGGNANPQLDGSWIELGPNFCGTDTVCP